MAGRARPRRAARIARTAGHRERGGRGNLRAPTQAAAQLRLRGNARAHRRGGRGSLAAHTRPARLRRSDPRDFRAYRVPAAALAGHLAGLSHGTDRPRCSADRGAAFLPDRRGDRVPGRDRAAAVRRHRIHRGPGVIFDPARTGGAADRHPAGRSYRQRLHRADRFDEGRRGNRCDAHHGPRPGRATGAAAGDGAGRDAAAAHLPRHDRGPAGRHGGVRAGAGHHADHVHFGVPCRHRDAALLGRPVQGADLRIPDRHHRLPRRVQGRGQRRIRGSAHHLKRGAIHLHGDPGGRTGGTVLHGDGLVKAAVNERGGHETLIEVRGLRTQFGEQVVHDNLDLDVHRGEILGVVGGSGTGKSVLLRTILGLRRPDAGIVRVFGQDLHALDEPRRIAIERRFGVLFQDGALFSSLTVSENIRVPLLEHTQLSLHDAQRVAALKVALVGLPVDVRQKYPSELSGGTRKRAALARALALDPEILFLDEPTSGLDPIAAAGFDALIKALRDALGLTVLMNTHDLDSLHTICDRVAVLAHKRVIVVDSLDRVERFNDPWIREYFGGPRGRAAEAAHVG